MVTNVNKMQKIFGLNSRTIMIKKIKTEFCFGNISKENEEFFWFHPLATSF